jgi:plasmid stability protein
MATITLKNIPDKLFERLKYFAKIRHRSLNSEIIYTLERSFGMIEEDPQRLREQAEEFRNQIAKRGQLTPDEIEKGINEGRP